MRSVATDAHHEAYASSVTEAERLPGAIRYAGHSQRPAQLLERERDGGSASDKLVPIRDLRMRYHTPPR